MSWLHAVWRATHQPRLQQPGRSAWRGRGITATVHAVAAPMPVCVIMLVKGLLGGSGWLTSRCCGNVVTVSLPSWRAPNWMS